MRLLKKSWFWFGMVAVAALVLTGLLKNNHDTDGSLFRNDRGTVMRRSTHLTALRATYLGFHNQPDQWWLEKAEVAEGFARGEYQLAFRDFANRNKVTIRTILEQHKDVNSLSRRIADRFSDFMISIRIDLEHALAMTPPSSALSDDPKKRLVQICFIPEDQFQFPNVDPSPLYFSDGSNVVFLASLHWPGKVLPSILFHELGHALYFLEGDREALTEVEEEVVMHELEGEIMNYTSGGRYFQKLDEVIGRNPVLSSWGKTMEQITLDDLRELDGVFDSTDCTNLIARLLVSNYFRHLAFRSIDYAFSDPEERGRMKCNAYRGLTGRWKVD
jgi:hypothetical protein